MCGVVGVIGFPRDQTLSRTLLLTHFVEDRGPQGAGVYLRQFAEGTHLQEYRAGEAARLIEALNAPDRKQACQADLAIGHVRYTTSGTDDPSCLQPLVRTVNGRTFALAFNGNLVQWHSGRMALGLSNTISDGQYILELLCRSTIVKSVDLLLDVFGKLRGAFSCVIAIDNALFAVRDNGAFWSLWLGKSEGGWAVASEDGALRHARYEVVRQIAPGEVVQINPDGPGYSRSLPKHCDTSRCCFEPIYFSRVDSEASPGVSNAMQRHRQGRLLGEDWRTSGFAPADLGRERYCVTPMLASGLNAAVGVAEALDLELRFGIFRDPRTNRNFLSLREIAAMHLDLKHSVDPYMLRGRDVIVVDDSLIRGRTACNMIRLPPH